MPIVVTERWSEDKLHSILQNGKIVWTATKGFDVSGTQSKVEAMAATGIPQYTGPSSFHPDNDRMTVSAIDPERTGPGGTWHIAVSYAILDQSLDPNQSDDPLQAPPEISWDLGNASEKIDRDIHGNPIVNAAGDPFGDSVTEDYGTVAFSITRNEPFFNASKALTYRNKINSDTVSLPGIGGSFAPGQLKCICVKPASKYTPQSTYVPVEYSFEARGGAKKDSDGLWDGFKKRVSNQGQRTWYDDNGTKKPGQIVDGDGKPVSSDVRLKADGTPFSSQFKVTEKKLSPVANPTSLPSTIAVDTETDAVFLKYQTLYTAALSGLELA